MSSRVRITSAFPTERDVATRLRLSSGRSAELSKQLYDLHISNPGGSFTVVETARFGGKSAQAPKGEKPARLRSAKRR